LVEPGSVGGCVVNLVTRVGSQPPLDSWMLVGSIVTKGCVSKWTRQAAM
jgi:hypothetical protein